MGPPGGGSTARSRPCRVLQSAQRVSSVSVRAEQRAAAGRSRRRRRLLPCPAAADKQVRRRTRAIWQPARPSPTLGALGGCRRCAGRGSSPLQTSRASCVARRSETRAALPRPTATSSTMPTTVRSSPYARLVEASEAKGGASSRSLFYRVPQASNLETASLL